MASESDSSHQASTSDVSSSTVPNMDLQNYRFPSHRLQRQNVEANKTPLVLVACGSFSPITILHLRMFSLAYDHVRANSNFTVVGAYLSPVSDAYKKAGLAPAHHRLRMAELAAHEPNDTTDLLMVDGWEAMQTSYVPTAKVLDHFEHEINIVIGGVEDVNGMKKPVRIALLAGADLIQTMSTPGVWSQDDLAHILGKYGAFVIERAGTDIQDALDSLKEWEHNIYYISQLIDNNVSSTKIRLAVKRYMSIDYLVPAAVVAYIKANGLYQDEYGTTSR